MTYMLNLIFDASDALNSDNVLNGRFDPYVAQTNWLLCSKAWLQPTVAAPGYDVSSDWELKQEDTGDPLTLQGGTQGDQIVVRVLGLNTEANANGTWLLRLSVVVSRDTPRAMRDNATPPKPYQTRASPFPMSGLPDQPCVTYEYENLNYQPMNSGPNTATSYSWIQPLGQANLITTVFEGGKPEGYYDAYSVIVAVTVGQGLANGQNTPDPINIRTYSHDPDMNVQC